MELNLIKINPEQLQPNPWNSNRVNEENQAKLDKSLERLGNFDPVKVRQLKDGTLQIICGYHRNMSAIRRGIEAVPVINLGEMDDTKAKEISLADNERYGEDDAGLLKELLDNLDTAAELTSFLPISLEDLDSFFAYDSIDLDDLDVDDDDDSPLKKPQPSSPTHRVVRFKMTIEDAEKLGEFIEAIKKSNGYTDSDELTNAGDSLVHILREVW